MEFKKTVKDDYGLTAARVLVTPLLSGLAALVGVLLVTMLSITLIQPASGATPAVTSFPKIETIYDFNMYPQNLVLAAIFGFLPSLVISLLKKETDKIESQIQSSSAGDQKQGTGAGKEENGRGDSD